MCGIFAYINAQKPRTRSEILKILVQGLRRLEYRGYDSAGVAVDVDGSTLIIKTAGNVDQLDAKIAGHEVCASDEAIVNHVGIAHTRWATHGEPCDRNAHPHTSDSSNAFVVVHNGIITNYVALKTLLEKKGVVFSTETDTEVIAKLTKYLYDQREGTPTTFVDVVTEVTTMLQGAYALLFKSRFFPGELVACKLGSPLIIGMKDHVDSACRVGEGELGHSPVPPKSSSDPEVFCIQSHREYFLASDAAAIVEHTRKVCYMEEADLVHIKDGIIHSYNKEENSKILISQDRNFTTLDMELESIMKGSFKHFMLKEIFEQPETIRNATRGRVNYEKCTTKLGGISPNMHIFRGCRRLVFIAAGTSYHSAVACRGIVEHMFDRPVQLEVASDFQDRKPPIFREDICCFISQSGETADVLECLKYCRDNGAFCVGLTNVVGSALDRGTHCGIHLNAGAEIGVASTKAYTAQIISLLMMSLVLSEDRVSKQEDRRSIIRAMQTLPADIEETLKLDGQIAELAGEWKDMNGLIFLGRGTQYATALEGALKVKEISYIMCEGIQAGELKHGPLALVDESLPVVVIATGNKSDALYTKLRLCLSQVSARSGKPVVICHPDDEEIRSSHRVLCVPRVHEAVQGIINIIPFQLLAYHLAVLKGLNVDCPRNLAKSVTVTEGGH